MVRATGYPAQVPGVSEVCAQGISGCSIPSFCCVPSVVSSTGLWLGGGSMMPAPAPR